SEEIVSALSANGRDVQYFEIGSGYGHDAFLLESGQLNYLIGRFLSRALIRDVMITDVPSIEAGSTIAVTARRMTNKEVNHLPVLSQNGKLAGIVTSWDIARAVALNLLWLDDIMTRDVVTITPEEPVESAVKKMEEYSISAIPVIDESRCVIGLVTSESISMLVGRWSS
ncbi:MAG: CBS domain-containing protein, partial [Methanoregulaceae archaeon]|nr:CBS domain-containing protein [Methanoregulaceae archaeon]